MMQITRAKVGMAGLAIVAAGVPLGSSLASGAAAAAKPAAGTIHVYVTNTSTNPSAPNKVLITGAFSDHGTGKGGTLHLTRGTITSNNSALAKITNSDSFGTFSPASCSFWGAATGPVRITKGTGAYVGIKGTVVVTLHEAAEGSLLANGTCNTASNAPAVASDLIIVGSGKVSF
jgi:hypothetical protein